MAEWLLIVYLLTGLVIGAALTFMAMTLFLVQPLRDRLEVSAQAEAHLAQMVNQVTRVANRNAEAYVLEKGLADSAIREMTERWER